MIVIELNVIVILLAILTGYLVYKHLLRSPQFYQDFEDFQSSRAEVVGRLKAVRKAAAKELKHTRRRREQAESDAEAILQTLRN